MDANQPDITSENPQEVVDIRTWFSRIKTSHAYMKNEFLWKWELARKRLRADYEVQSTKGKYRTHRQVDLVYAIGVSYINSVIFKAPDVNLIADNEDEAELVENTEVKINDFFNGRKSGKKVKKALKRCAWDAFLSGVGAIYIDWDYNDRPTNNPAMDQSGQPMLDDNGQPQMQRVVLKNEPVLMRIRPDMLLFPDGFDLDQIQEQNWIGFSTLLPIEQLQDNPNFNKSVVATAKGNYYRVLSDADRKSYSKEQGDQKYVKLHYIFENTDTAMDSIRMMVLLDENKATPLQDWTDFDKGNFGFPIKFLYHNPLDDDDSYPNGDPWIWESQLAFIDRYWKKMFDHVKRINPHILVDIGKINKAKELVQKLKSSEDLEYASVDTKQGSNIADALHKFEHSPVPADFHQMYGLSRSLLNEMSPRTDLSRGVEDNPQQKATVANIIQQNEMIDLDARVDDIKEFIISIAMDLAGMFAKSFVGVGQVNGTLSDGKKINRQIDKTGYTANFTCEIDVQSMQHPNREVYRRQLLDLMNQLQLAQPELAKKGKTLDFEPLIDKVVDNIGIRGSNKWIIDMNMRSPSKEHEDLAFQSIPFEQHPCQLTDNNILEHFNTLNDPIKSQVYEKLHPGFNAKLAAHVDGMAKQRAANRPAQPTPQARPPINGQRKPMATEMARR